MAYRGNGPQSSNGFMNGRVEQVSQFGYGIVNFISIFANFVSFPSRISLQFFSLSFFIPSDIKLIKFEIDLETTRRKLIDLQRSKLSILIKIKIKNIYIYF